MKRITFITLALTFALAAPSDSGEAPAETVAGGSPKKLAELYNKGNAAYRDGGYDTAVNLYTRIAEEAGVFDPSLYYNLANAHMKRGEIGKSILYYRRALEIDPRDADIIANLEYARTLREDRIDEESSPAATGKISKIIPRLTLNEYAGIELVLFTVFSILIFTVTAIKLDNTALLIKLKKLSLIFGILLVAQTLLLGARTSTYISREDAVILEKTVSVFSAPSAGAEKLFDLHEGTEVSILQSDNDFLEITLPTGWKGWIHHMTLELI
ncbi:MAG: tetratricopeptide repeat protein [Nitrospinota bacterium]|nr:tetratricopeptide repeat protein [Nitrospinota bacterium]